MSVNSFVAGASDVLTTEIPGLGVDALYLAGAAAVIGIGIWGLRKMYHGVFG